MYLMVSLDILTKPYKRDHSSLNLALRSSNKFTGGQGKYRRLGYSYRHLSLAKGDMLYDSSLYSNST